MRACSREAMHDHMASESYAGQEMDVHVCPVHCNDMIAVHEPSLYNR